MAREAPTQNDVRMLRMAIDHEVAVGREAVHAGLCFAKFRGGARHPFLHGGSDWSDIASHVHFAIEFVGGRKLPETVEGGFYAIPEIGEPIERRGQSRTIEQEGWKQIDAVGMGARRKPCLDVSLDSQRHAKGIKRLLEPRA